MTHEPLHPLHPEYRGGPRGIPIATPQRTAVQDVWIALMVVEMVIVVGIVLLSL